MNHYGIAQTYLIYSILSAVFKPVSINQQVGKNQQRKPTTAKDRKDLSKDDQACAKGFVLKLAKHYLTVLGLEQSFRSVDRFNLFIMHSVIVVWARKQNVMAVIGMEGWFDDLIRGRHGVLNSLDDLGGLLVQLVVTFRRAAEVESCEMSLL